MNSTRPLKFVAADLDGSTDTIKDLMASQGHKIDLLSALSGYTSGANLANWVQFTADLPTGVVTLKVDSTGQQQFTTPQLTIQLENVYNYSSLQSLRDAVLI